MSGYYVDGVWKPAMFATEAHALDHSFDLTNTSVVNQATYPEPDPDPFWAAATRLVTTLHSIALLAFTVALACAPALVWAAYRGAF